MKVARETEFVRRAVKKIQPHEFLKLLVFSNINYNDISLSSFANSYAISNDISLCKQSLDERFTEKSTEFIKQIMLSFLQKIILETKNKIDFLEDFESIRIKDSTSFQISSSMVGKFKSSDNENSTAMIRIQFEYDLKTGHIYDFSLHSSAEQDTTDAILTVENINKNDLILRDLGYIVNSVLTSIDKKGAFFVNRFNSTANCYESEESKIPIDLSKIQKKLIKYRIQSIEKKVFIGAKDRIPVRMIIELLPDAQVKERIRKLKRKQSRKGITYSAEYYSRIRLNVYITNASSLVLPLEKIRQLYRLRWQIELVFKVFKSIGKIELNKKMKAHRFETMLYGRLIFMLICWLLYWKINTNLMQHENKNLSLYKTFTTIVYHIAEIKLMLKYGIKLAYDFYKAMINTIINNDTLEKNKKRQNFYDLMKLFGFTEKKS